MARNKAGTTLLKKQIATLNKVKSTLPVKIGNTCESFFKASFRKQGWDDQSVQRWKQRKGEITAGVSMIAKGGKGGRAILVKSGALRRSIHTTVANWKRVVIESDLPYSAIHNYGLIGSAYGKHRFKMPQRKFMGRSYHLNKKVTELMERELNKIF